MTRTALPHGPPYRVSEYQASCSLCGSDAALCCPRCASPLCLAHGAAGDLRCPECEETFAARGGRLGWVSLVLALLTSAGALAGVLNAGLFAEQLVLVVLAAIAAVPLVGLSSRVLLRGVSRRRFLREGDGNTVLAEHVPIAVGAGAGEARRLGTTFKKADWPNRIPKLWAG
jgi:hypothetical protein